MPMRRMHARRNHGVIEVINEALGLEADRLTIMQMALRAVIVYVVALLFVRMGDKRFLGKNTAFDVAVGIMFGSVMSRAITNASDFLPIVVAGGVMLGLHWAIAVVAFRSDEVGVLVKGSERRLVEDGEIRWHEMAAAHIGERDLLGALRQSGVEDVGRVSSAYLERSGDVSVIERSDAPRVLDIEVADGVQTVRIVV
jgi:uncharacterized membrane protein YcaP (DUF421 family)